ILARLESRGHLDLATLWRGQRHRPDWISGERHRGCHDRRRKSERRHEHGLLHLSSLQFAESVSAPSRLPISDSCSVMEVIWSLMDSPPLGLSSFSSTAV